MSVRVAARALAAAGAATVCWASSATGAHAAVTVGNNFATEPVTGFCGLPCTTGLSVLPAGHQAPGGTQIPNAGVVVRWRLKTGAGVAPVQTRLRILSGDTAVAASREETLPAQAGVYAFETRIPVQPGQGLGVDLINPDPEQGVPIGRQAVAGSIATFWIPPFADGETRAPASTAAGLALYVNADLEPDADLDGHGDESQDSCPAAGTDSISPCGPPSVTITKAPKPKTRSKKARFRFASDDPGARFECAVDRDPFDPCASPLQFRVKRGRHKLRVQAVDADDNRSASSARAKWRVKKRKR